MDINIPYKGYIDVTVTEKQWADFYSNPTNNIFGCLQNQYILLKDREEKYKDKFIWSGSTYKELNHKTINNGYVGKVKAKNIQQECAFDLLLDKNTTIKVITGKFGSGKTFLMVAHALQAIMEGKFDKIVWVRNNINVKDTEKLGALPGTEFEKLLPFVGPLIDHMGGMTGVEMLMHQGKLEVQHLGFIRGRDIKHSIILCSEAENLTKQHIQLLIGRVGEGSNLWLDGDFKQVDGEAFERNAGLKVCIDKLKGHPMFGYVNLEKSERSATAALADLLD